MEITNELTPIKSKSYSTIGDLLKAPVRSIISVTSRMEKCSERDFLYEWLYKNHYSKQTMEHNLTNRIKKISNKVCFDYFSKHCFNNLSLTDFKTKTILTEKSIAIITRLHTIEPSLCGTFIDYLMRRIICKIKYIDFNDSRVDRMVYVNKQIDIKNTNGNFCPTIIVDTSEPLRTFNKYNGVEYCNYDLYFKVKDKNSSIKNIMNDIFLISLCHGESFGGRPNTKKVEAILNEINNPEFYNDFVCPFYNYCDELVKDKKNIYLNPALGCIENNIPGDCDIIIDNKLIDIKCTIGDNSIYEILQLLGYCSLGQNNPKYNHIDIKEISIINLKKGIEYTYIIDNVTKDGLFKYLKILEGKTD